MKFLALGLITLMLCSVNKNNDTNSIVQNASDSSFALRYIFIGFGSNMFEMQPGFTINGTKFIYTSEEVWGYPGEKRQIDTLATGNVRRSSVDSIINLISNIQDTLVWKTNIHVMSGGEADISISYGGKKLNFSLWNTSDTTATKIADILDTYIPAGNRKLISFKNQFPSNK